MESYSIAFIITCLGRAGAEKQLVQLATGLRERGVDVKGVITLLPPAAFTEELAAGGIPLVSLDMRPALPDPRALSRAITQLRAWRPAVLVNFLYHANVLGRLAGWRAKVPLIVSSVRSNNFGGPLRYLSMRLTDHLGVMTTTNSHAVADGLIRRKVAPAHKLRVIPNGIDIALPVITAEERLRRRSELGVGENDFLWLAAGRLAERKDYPALFTALRILRERGVGAKLSIAGDGPIRDSLHNMVTEMHLGDSVHFLGERTDMPALLSCADALVLSSVWEGTPNTVMEALLAETPVVATAVGGVPELLENGLGGYLTPPHAPQALARAMERMMRLSSEERACMGAWGRQHIAARHAREGVMDQWERLFQDLLLRRRGNEASHIVVDGKMSCGL